MNRRINRINEEIRNEVGDLLLHDLKDPRIKGLVSVLRVDTSSDLGHAKIYLSVLGKQEDGRDTLQAMQSSKGYIRRELVARLKLRHVPELHFILDDSIETGFRINEILKNLKKDT